MPSNERQQPIGANQKQDRLKNSITRDEVWRLRAKDFGLFDGPGTCTWNGKYRAIPFSSERVAARKHTIVTKLSSFR